MQTDNNINSAFNFFTDHETGLYNMNSSLEPGALLDILAEVASQTLKFDRDKKTIQKQVINHSTSLSTSRLIKNFSDFYGDEMRRTFTYKCSFDKALCQESFSSFGSEGKARQLMKAHLLFHVKAARELPVKPRTQRTHKPRKKRSTDKLKYLSKATKTKSTIVMASSIVGCSTEVAEKSEEKRFGDLDKFMLGEVNNESVVIAYMKSDEVQFMPLPHVGQEIAIKTTDIPASELVSTTEELSTSDSNNRHEGNQKTKKTKRKSSLIEKSQAEKDKANELIEALLKCRSSNLPALECRICRPQRQFTAVTTLLGHYRSHAGIKPFQCHICRQSFTRQHSLNYHLLIHSNSTRFTCADCGRRFRHPSHFKEHRRRHTGESPFGCNECAIRFKTRNTYKRHLKTRHGKQLTSSNGLLDLPDSLTQVKEVNKENSNKVGFQKKINMKNVKSSLSNNAALQNEKEESAFLTVQSLAYLLSFDKK